MPNRGKFITLEGGEGSGKSTQIALLTNWIRVTFGNINVIETREPGGTPSAEAIRALLVEGDTDRWKPLSEALLHNAARVEHLVSRVKPALENGTWVICDRFIDSTLAYQGYGHGLEIETVAAINSTAMQGIEPDLTLILDMDVETGLSRAGLRQGTEDRYERMGQPFHERVHQGFREIAKQNPHRCALVDGRANKDTVFKAICQIIKSRLPDEWV